MVAPAKWCSMSNLLKSPECKVKPVLSGHSKRSKLVFMTDYCLMQVKSIAECSKGSILQYIRLSLSHHLSLTSLLCLFWSGRLRQGLLYCLMVSHNTKMTHPDHPEMVMRWVCHLIDHHFPLKQLSHGLELYVHSVDDHTL